MIWMIWGSLAHPLEKLHGMTRGPGDENHRWFSPRHGEIGVGNSTKHSIGLSLFQLELRILDLVSVYPAFLDKATFFLSIPPEKSIKPCMLSIILIFDPYPSVWSKPKSHRKTWEFWRKPWGSTTTPFSEDAVARCSSRSLAKDLRRCDLWWDFWSDWASWSWNAIITYPLVI
jgi:hypothetical protein